MHRLFRRRLPRRLVTVGATLVVGTIGLVLSPVALAGAALLDRRAPWQRVRIVALVVGTLVIEIIGLIGAAFAWIATGFGLASTKRWTWRLHRPLMGWYTSTLLAWIARVLGTRVEWRTPNTIDGPAIVLARHTSFFDAVIPATLVSRHHQLVAHHVITDGLRWLPNLDIVGHRIPTRFIRRTGSDRDDQTESIAEIGGLLDAGSAAIIFPEGTFRTERRFSRRLERLTASRPDLAATAEQLRHVLPPQPGGAHALLRHAPPEVTVLICANTGLEPFGTLAEMVASLRADRPIVVEAWNVEYADIPQDADAFSSWLLDQYRQIDDWVESQRSLS